MVKMDKLSKLGKKAIFNAYHIYYQAIDKGCHFFWHTNTELTKNDLGNLFNRLYNNTYNKNCFVKNFVFDFMHIDWNDLLEK